MSYLSLFGILSGRFAKLFGCAGYIEDIIYYLERRTYVCAILVTAAEKIFIVGPECRSPVTAALISVPVLSAAIFVRSRGRWRRRELCPCPGPVLRILRPVL